MNFNFFDWLRNGVKSSVLLGVTDAVNTMGMPPDEETSKDKILSFLQKETQSPQRRIPAPGSSNGNRKAALGRSINDLNVAKEA